MAQKSNLVHVSEVLFCKTGCCFPFSPYLEYYVLKERSPCRGSLLVPATSHVNSVNISAVLGINADQGKYILRC